MIAACDVVYARITTTSISLNVKNVSTTDTFSLHANVIIVSHSILIGPKLERAQSNVLHIRTPNIRKPFYPHLLWRKRNLYSNEISASLSEQQFGQQMSHKYVIPEVGY